MSKKGAVGRAMCSLAPYTHTFVCVSDYVRHLVNGYGVPAKKCQVIYNGTQTNVQKEFPSSLREDLNIEFDVTVVGTTGIWRTNKGFPYFIAAAEMLHQWLPAIRFLLGGKAYGADTVFATSLWIRGSILRSMGALEYTGFQEDVGRFMSALDIFVLPSDCEPFGLVLVEAMARGIPVVATNAGGVPEIMVHGETGYLVPPQDPDALAKAIYNLITQPALRQQMGENARARVKKYFDRQVMVDQYQALYARIIRETA